MNSDWILAIIAIAAIVSPILVAMTNNRHAERIQDAKLKFEYDTKSLSFEEELRSKRIDSLTFFIACLLYTSDAADD